MDDRILVIWLIRIFQQQIKLLHILQIKTAVCAQATRSISQFKEALA